MAKVVYDLYANLYRMEPDNIKIVEYKKVALVKRLKVDVRV